MSMSTMARPRLTSGEAARGRSACPAAAVRPHLTTRQLREQGLRARGDVACEADEPGPQALTAAQTTAVRSARGYSSHVGLERESASALDPREGTGTRLTRRGRVLVLVLLAGLMLGAFSLGRVASQASTTTGSPQAPSYEQTTVQPGESLWTVARRIAPHNDPRDVIEQIRRINHLSGSQLRAGQQLLLPTAA